MTSDIFRQLNCKRIDVGANYLVGMDSRIQKVNLLLRMESNDVRIVGIYGVGGIGKTTIAKVICNELACKFEAMSCLENIRAVSHTHGLPHLKDQLLCDITDGGRGATMIKKRVLIVLDDVDDWAQLECLHGIGEWLGEGSRVIITTRNQHMLTIAEVDDSYEVPGLNREEDIKLFNRYAFRQNAPSSEFANLSNQIIQYCQGLPLALKVLGSLLLAKTVSEWKSELRKLETEPEKGIHNVLKTSFDGLNVTEQQIFLDVACFFEHAEDKDSVSRILDGCNFHAEIGLKNLNDRCLITMPFNEIHMHDLIRKTGREIVRGDLPNKPHKWSRLWYHRDINLALTRDKGIHGLQTISLDLSKFESIRFTPNVFAKMTGLRLLKVHSKIIFYPVFDENFDEEYDEEYGQGYACDFIRKNASKLKLDQDFRFPSGLRYLRWDGYPLKYLPSDFEGGDLIELALTCSNMKQLSQGNKLNLQSLTVLDIRHSHKLIRMPDFSSMSNLEKLKARGCVSLIEIHPSIGVLKKLTILDLSGCKKLLGLPSSIINLESLEILDLFGCSSFQKFPDIQGNMRRLRHLSLSGTAIRELPSGIGLESVEILYLSNCFKFEKFPENGANMRSLKKLFVKNSAVKELPIVIANSETLTILDLSNCSKFEKFPEKITNMKSLRKLYLRNTAIKYLPDGIEESVSLKILDLSNCSKFEKFPEKIENMRSLRELYLRNTAIKYLPDGIEESVSLEILDLSDCSKFEKFPEKIENMKNLRELYLRNTAIKYLSDSIEKIVYLRILDLSNCSKFEKFPEKIENMRSLRELYLRNTAIKYLPDSIDKIVYLQILDLSDCSKLEKFPEVKRGMNYLKILSLRGTAIKELPSFIFNLRTLLTLNLGEYNNSRSLPENNYTLASLERLILYGCSDLLKGSILNLLRNPPMFRGYPSRLSEIGADGFRSMEDLWDLFWCCHYYWLTSLDMKYFRAVFPESSGIAECIRCDKLGSEVTMELPVNWYEDRDFQGYIVSFVYQPSIDYLICELNIHGNGFEFKDKTWYSYPHTRRDDLNDRVSVGWYRKMAIPKEHRHKVTHVAATFRTFGKDRKIKKIVKCGITLIRASDFVKNQMPMLLNHHGNSEAPQNGEAMLLDLPWNFGDNGSVEQSNGNSKRRRDEAEEP